MQLFFISSFEGNACVLSEEESWHCMKVLRLKVGDEINLADGQGRLFRGVLTKIHQKGCLVEIKETRQVPRNQWQTHVAIAPTKNIDRFEWFLEKATEIGIDEITPLICEHSERDIVKLPRLEKVLVSAMKQSLKAWLPKLNEPVKFKDLISGKFRDLKSGEFRDLKSSEFRDLKSGEFRDLKSGESRDLISGEFRGQKFIGYCETGDESALENIYIPGKDAVILIGPEGDFSKKEVETATMAGFIPVNLGTSRLRTETAGIVACHTIELLNRMKVRDAGHETRDAGHGTRDKMTNDQ